jgi:hypothetical protein
MKFSAVPCPTDDALQITFFFAFNKVSMIPSCKSPQTSIELITKTSLQSEALQALGPVWTIRKYL